MSFAPILRWTSYIAINFFVGKEGKKTQSMTFSLDQRAELLTDALVNYLTFYTPNIVSYFRSS